MATIRLRRGTAAAWTAADPVLAAGELGIEVGAEGEPTNAKAGNGIDSWTELDYLGGGGGGSVPAASDTVAGIVELATAAEAVAGADGTRAVTPAGIAAAVAALVDASPSTLNTLNELAAALGDDPNFATTITTALGGKQAADATLTALAAVATAANKLIYANGSDSFTTTDLTAFARTILDDADGPAVRVTIGAGAAARTEDVTTTRASSTTPTPAVGAQRTFYAITALAGAAAFAAPTGTPADGDALIVRVKDDGSARVLTWDAAYRDAGPGLPATTVAGKALYLGFMWNANVSKWDLIAKTQVP